MFLFASTREDNKYTPEDFYKADGDGFFQIYPVEHWHLQGGTATVVNI